jgi:hypothetical protein
MIIHRPNGATIVVNDCHWTEGAYLAITHAGGAGTILDLEAIDQVNEELQRIRAAILERREQQQKQEKEAA